MREMVGMCSPFIGDECDIFTCSISFPNEWDIQIRVSLKQELNEAKKSEALYSNIKSVCEWTCLFDEHTCVFETVVPIPTEWMYLFGDNLFWPNGCVYSANRYVYSERLCPFHLNRCVCSKGLHLLQLKDFLWFLNKGQNITPKNNQNNSKFIFFLLLSEYKVCLDKNSLQNFYSPLVRFNFLSSGRYGLNLFWLYVVLQSAVQNM